MGTKDILNAEAEKDLIAKSVTDIATKECIRFGVKDVFVSSVTINTRRSSAFISALNILQDKFTTYQFHFIDNSNIIQDGLHLNRSGKTC